MKIENEPSAPFQASRDTWASDSGKAISRFPFRSIALFCASVFLGIASLGFADKSPNIVFILGDDQGWNALSTQMDPNEPGSGSLYYHTPRLAQLAADGMRFSQAYSPAPTCSPSRHAIQFGRSPSSLKIFGADGIKDFDAQEAESLANTLKSINPEYVCAHLGKWHIDRSPSVLGYDVHDGKKMNADGNSTDPNDPKLIFDLSRRSNAFMEAQVKADKPFFLQISHYANHLKYQAQEKTIQKYATERADKATPYQNSPLWAAMNENLDTGVGMVLDQIEKLGIADNTYVIYTADNGYEAKTDFGKPVHERGFYKAYPQRSHKYHVSEGGIRVPFIVRGPGIPANTFSTVPVVGTDVFTTVMDLAGGRNRMPAKVEGASLAAHVKSGGKRPILRKDPFLVFKYTKERPPHDATIVQGNYKLIKDIDTGRLFLFNLNNDIGESRNLAQEKPELTKRMYADMTAYFNRFGWDESQIKNDQRMRAPAAKPVTSSSNSVRPTQDRPPVVSPSNPLRRAQDRPNIILILADDQGWNGLSVPMDPNVSGSKSDFYQTPNLARLAKGGMRFSQGYAAAPVCSPTRHSIQFGISPAKTRVTHNSPENKQFCDPAIALPNLIKKADPRYTTAHFGKWHVSAKPEDCGYDISDGSTGNRDGDTSKDPNDPKRVYGVTKRSIAFMENAVDSGKPFFIQVSHYADHLTFKSSPAMLKKYQPLPKGRRHSDPVFAGMNEDLDAGVGALLDAVERLDIADNTYIFYLADNGFDQSNDQLHGIAQRKAWPLSYSKGFVSEGGIRVPFIVRGPGIEAGAFSKQPVVGYDLMPTFLELIKPGFKLPEVTEGGSLLPVLNNGGRGKVDRPNDFLLFHYPTGVWPSQTSMVQGDYKIVKSWAYDRVELFNLRKDVSETKDLSAAMPEKTAQMHRAMMKYLGNVNATLPPEAELENDRKGLLMKKGAGAQSVRNTKTRK